MASCLRAAGEQPSTSAAMETFLEACVRDALDAHLLPNAVFLAERLYAANCSEANAFVLATCYFRNNQAFRACHVLRGCVQPQSRYLLAMSFFKLGGMLEAEQALCPDHKHEISEIPNGAAGHYLMGMIQKRQSKRPLAVEHFAQALALDPFLWCAYEELCQMGADEEAAAALHNPELDRLYHLRPPEAVLGGGASAHLHTPLTPASESTAPSPSKPHLRTGEATGWKQPLYPATPASRGRNAGVAAGTSGGTAPWTLNFGEVTPQISATSGEDRGASPRAEAGASPCAFVTPSPGAFTDATPAAPPLPNPPAKLAPPPVRRGGPPQGTSLMSTPTRKSRKLLDEGKLRKVSGQLFGEGGRTTTPASSLSGVRRSSRLATITQVGDHSAGKPPVGLGRRAGGGGGVPGSPAPRGARPHSAPAGAPSPTRTADGAAQALQLLRLLGEGYRQVCMYRCGEAIETLLRLPPAQYATGWVLCTVGRAYFERVEYAEAERVFEWARRVDPTRLEGMDVFSTVLWHLKKEVDLSYLAQEAVALNRLAPQAWVVMGNCFSLQKEHETAQKFFSRALQLDPNLAYAHTLCGHEYFANEDFEKGLACFQDAIKIDPRHYNAWYGLGTIYYRQEKYQMAEYNFRRALSINMHSSVLFCYLGMAMHALGKNVDAITLLQTAIRKDSKNPLAKFQKASVLMSEARYLEALEELEALKECAPKEASVFFLMGKIYKKLNMVNRASVSFNIALDLKPPTTDINLIKSAIERLTLPGDCEEEDL